jgi:hypothetical protein
LLAAACDIAAGWYYTGEGMNSLGDFGDELDYQTIREDVCGNTPYGAFDGPLRSADEMVLETAARSIPFEVKRM